MAAARTGLATKPFLFPNLDLKWSLMLRVLAVALICFLIAAAFAFFWAYRDARRVNETVADILARQMQVQLFRIDSDIDAMAHFPDWDPVIGLVQHAGQCIEYIRPDGSVGRSSCVGSNRADGVPPAWLSSLGAWILGGYADVVRPISYRRKSYGTLVVTTEPLAVFAAVWKEVAGLLALTTMLVVATCVLQYIAISRALRPTKDILVGLDKLAHGDLACRLPNFRLIELQRISEVFNTLAMSLDRTMRERTELAAKLVDGQEQERLHFARELHDELAQTLSAMSALAASIKATAEAECPGLVPEANNLVKTSITAMKSLRATLRSLRPPEIDDFGLAPSLTALARDQERRAGGELKISLEVDDDLRGLSPTAAAHIYRIIQEGLTNIGKHANAGRARVALGFRSETAKQTNRRWRCLALTIENDRCKADRDTDAEGGGFGLIGMRERVMALGGQLDIVHLGDRGFRLHAVIPLEAPAGLLQ
jgi:two-component system, NarL family, sensor histidine kinase UhpB